MKNPQKVDILAKYWVLKIEAELVRRGETDSLKIIATGLSTVSTINIYSFRTR